MNLLDIEKAAEQALQAAIDHEGIINSIATMTGILPQVSLIEKSLPIGVALLQFAEQETGKPPLDILKDFLDHMLQYGRSIAGTSPAPAPATQGE